MNLEEIAKRVGDEPHIAQQKWTELLGLLELIAPLKPKNILEIGVYKGGTLQAWTYIADDKAKIIGIDLPNGEFGGGFSDDEGLKITELKRHQQKIYLMAVDSHEKTTVDLVKKHDPFDFIFIDADHRYEGVKKDYENYLPLLKKGGVMAFHDIVKHDEKHPDVDVDRFWAEIKDKHESYEFIDMDFPSDWNPWGGIGAIIK